MGEPGERVRDAAVLNLPASSERVTRTPKRRRWLSDEQETYAMPQMFDWIFFAIMLPFPAFLLWDFYSKRDYSRRDTSKSVQQL